MDELKELYYATSSRMKFGEAEEFFKRFMPHITLKQCDKDFHELQTLDQKAIALHKAQQAWDYLKAPVLADDAGLYFNKYHEFPGTMTKFVLKGIGYEGIFKLIDHNEKAALKCVLVFMYDQDLYQIFEATCTGKIVHTMNFNYMPDGGPFDTLFVPDGETRTYDELRRAGQLTTYNYRAYALKTFSEWLQNSMSEHNKEVTSEPSPFL